MKKEELMKELQDKLINKLLENPRVAVIILAYARDVAKKEHANTWTEKDMQSFLDEIWAVITIGFRERDKLFKDAEFMEKQGSPVNIAQQLEDWQKRLIMNLEVIGYGFGLREKLTEAETPVKIQTVEEIEEKDEAQTI